MIHNVTVTMAIKTSFGKLMIRQDNIMVDDPASTMRLSRFDCLFCKICEYSCLLLREKQRRELDGMQAGERELVRLWCFDELNRNNDYSELVESQVFIIVCTSIIETKSSMKLCRRCERMQ
jgi:hypothetical protein